MVKCPFKMDFAKYMSDGPSGFMRIPVVDDINGYDILFAALPYECDSSAKPGSRNGAAYFRRDLFGFGFCDQGLDIDMAQSVKSGDCGDLVIDSSSEEAAEKSIFTAAQTMLSTGACSYMIGGDDKTAYAQIKACYEKFGKTAVIHFGGSISSALVRAAEEGMCLNDASIEVGIRNGFCEYGEKLAALGIKAVTASDIDYMPLEDVGALIKEKTAGKPVFVIFDVNFFDPAFVTSAAKPYAGGFTAYETVAIIESALVGLDIKSISLCGMLDYNDPGETSLNNMAEAASKLYAIAAFNIATAKEK
ncbi:arginase family protein [uncultured Ruminococcus sp.]|uniref:arginase family protein n=1 Tax=uncultured Ruminococcus sp. TaxID=165186 RepID=UPI0025D7B891|nr:arginase family protein [uncultured Ruminococcus sp.]